MSIAITATIKPSRFLWVLIHAMCASMVLVGAAIGAGMAGNFPFPARLAIACTSIICPLFALHHVKRHLKTCQIDISGIGVIRLMHDGDMQSSENEVASAGETVRLMEQSTLWSGLMFLWLQSENGKHRIVQIFPDSVSPGEFRALSVACRWIASRRNEEGSPLSLEPTDVT